MQTARELFTDNGFRDTSILDIAEKSELAAGTIYNYFCSKGALLLSMLSENIEETIDSTTGILEKSKETADRIHILLDGFTDFYARFEKPLWREALAAAYGNEDFADNALWNIQAQFQNTLQGTITLLWTNRILRRELSPETITSVIYNIFFMHFLKYINTASTVEQMKKSLREQMTTVFSGILNKESLHNG